MSVISNSQVKLTSASGVAIYADSLPAPTADLNGRDGWLYTKTSGAEKFNYYIWSQGSKPLRLRELRSVSMVASVDTYTDVASVPFVVIYTKPTGVGDEQPWYHSKISHSFHNQSSVIMLGERVQFYTHQILPSESYGVRRISLPVEIKSGDALPDEEILYITVQSDSAGANNTQILISDCGIETNHQERIQIRLKLDGN
tara:strand:+ start:176 stop:775 length:600 start_codon:yes stop_codon:yes gene_type:complete